MITFDFFPSSTFCLMSLCEDDILTWQDLRIISWHPGSQGDPGSAQATSSRPSLRGSGCHAPALLVIKWSNQRPVFRSRDLYWPIGIQNSPCLRSRRGHYEAPGEELRGKTEVTTQVTEDCVMLRWWYITSILRATSDDPPTNKQKWIF